MSIKMINISKQLDLIEQEFDNFRSFDVKIGEIASLNPVHAGIYLQTFIQGYNLVNTLYSKAIRAEIEAKAVQDELEAIAFLEQSVDYFKAKGDKPTDTAKKQFVEMAPEVIDSKNLLARATSYVKFLQGKMVVYNNCEHAVKKIAYGTELNQ